MPLYQLCCLVEEEVKFFLFFLEEQNVLFKILAAWKALKDLSVMICHLLMLIKVIQ